MGVASATTAVVFQMHVTTTGPIYHQCQAGTERSDGGLYRFIRRSKLQRLPLRVWSVSDVHDTAKCLYENDNEKCGGFVSRPNLHAWHKAAVGHSKKW